ncbi:halocarboxylic acid dehydrogenase DehI family protein [Lentibacillus jeotgali]|uniref:halocarboxylic acid dehydrogenase DehI family protein n=1 Tax=Lentibacillus jeotgali TaxID=558169 RepID=UPI000262932A|nr:halocarboxylic acid dehydrogenase DehI family protein [Lentibacillus jeotgali]
MDNYGVPEIFESEAKGLTALIYQDIKYVLKVPVVNFMFRTSALYEEFFEIAWSQIRLNMLTVNMEKAAQLLRFPHLSVNPPKLDLSQAYNEPEMLQIKKILSIFNYVNPKLLLIASAWSESLANRPIRGTHSIEGFIKPGVFPPLPQVNLMHIPNASSDVKDLLLDIAEKHQSFDVASDFRALAFYPKFLSEVWKYLGNYVGTDEYNVISSNLKSQSIQYAHQMPYPVTINRQTLEKYHTDAEIAGIYGVVSMFQSFLANLIVDGEFLRRMIEQGQFTHR